MESFPILTCRRSEKMVCACILRGKGNWDDLMKKFCERFFPLSKVQHIRKQVINFAQGEKEGIDQAWDRFNRLIEQGLKLGFSGDVLLHTFYFSLTPSACNLFKCVQEEISWRKHSRKPPNSYKKSARARPCEEIGKNDVRQAPRKNLKCGCLLEFSEKRHRK